MQTVEILIIDEHIDEDYESTGTLNLETGWVINVQRPDNFPENITSSKNYEYSYGKIVLPHKEIEFSLQFKNNQYQISREELKEIKEFAIKTNIKPKL